ncbi:hypothetical protein, partial [Yersinia pseudotuberculosis]|uniref:hypothetical protein n=1 Tax=Yersinia pseudotuberculosis TaxID=633 RepID=UPI001E5BFAEA
ADATYSANVLILLITSVKNGRITLPFTRKRELRNIFVKTIGARFQLLLIFGQLFEKSSLIFL